MPLLGICLGLQALFASSDEAPDDAGLSIFPGNVAALPATAKLPHMGWNQLRRVRPSALLEGIPADAYFYFAHSYAALDAGECGRGHVRSWRAVCGRARAREPLCRAVSPGKIGRRGSARAGEFRGPRRRAGTAHDAGAAHHSLPRYRRRARREGRAIS